MIMRHSEFETQSLKEAYIKYETTNYNITRRMRWVLLYFYLPLMFLIWADDFYALCGGSPSAFGFVLCVVYPAIYHAVYLWSTDKLNTAALRLFEVQ